MHILKNGRRYEPDMEYSGKKIMISIDSSKTDSCMTVADEFGVRLDDYELCGEPKDDVLAQCQWERRCLSTILANSLPSIVGIEDIITKKEDGKFSAGIETHQTRFKITAIFMSFICFFQDTFNITPELVNNWSWKSTVLPEQYRTQEHHKGSLDWHKDRGTPLSKRNDNVTDSDCIMEYLKIVHGIFKIDRISDIIENTSNQYQLAICSGKYDVGGLREFKDNKLLMIKDKISYIVNRLSVNEIAYVKIDIHVCTPQQVYSLCYGDFNKKEDEVVLLVRRIK